MINDILFDVSSVKEFKEKLLEIKSNKTHQSFFDSIDIEMLIVEIDRVASYKSVNSIKFVVYPNNSGYDLLLGKDIEDLSNKFGWTYKELENV